MTDERLWVRFDGPPSHNSGRFIELETESGRSIGPDESRTGWYLQNDGTWLLGPFSRVEEAAPSTDEGEEGAWSRSELSPRYARWTCTKADDPYAFRVVEVPVSLEAAIRAPLEEQIRALQTTNYRCEELCEAAQYGGSCRCSHLSNELPAAEERIRELGAELNGTVATYMETTGDMGAEVLELRAENQRLREALRWAYDQFPPEMHGAVHPVLDRALATPPSSTEGTKEVEG